MKHIINKDKSRAGLTSWEISLFVVFLSVVVGTFVFFFFLNSHDMRRADEEFQRIQMINEKLDNVCEEISNAAEVIHPFDGSSNECYFRVYEDSDLLVRSANEEGFMFKDNKLFHVSKEKPSQAKNVMLGSIANPILEICKSCTFTRLGPDLLEIDIGISGINTEKIDVFKRSIKLRN